MGIFPLAGFWSKDEILAGANQLGGDGGYKLMLVMGLIGAFCTCAYMTRAIWYVFFGEPRGAAAEHTPHESGPRITVPLMILAGLAVVAGFANLPDTGVLVVGARERRAALRALRRAHRRLLPGRSRRRRSRHPEFTFWIAVVSTAGRRSSASRSPTSGSGRASGPHGITERNRLARAGYTVLENKYYLDCLYTDVIVGGIKGPIARAANWVNQNVIDGVVNLRRARRASRRGQWVYDNIDQGVVDTVVNGSGAGRRGLGPAPAQAARPARCRRTAPTCSRAATVLAAIFVVIASAELTEGDAP